MPIRYLHAIRRLADNLSSVVILRMSLILWSRCTSHHVPWVPWRRIAWVMTIYRSSWRGRPTSIIAHGSEAASRHLSRISRLPGTRGGGVSGICLCRWGHRFWATRTWRRISTLHLMLLRWHASSTCVVRTSPIISHRHMVTLLRRWLGGWLRWGPGRCWRLRLGRRVLRRP